MHWTCLLTLAVIPVVFALPQKPTDIDPGHHAIWTVDKIMFDITLPEFEERRKNRDPPDVDWHSDACTNAPDKPFGFDFKSCCQRHDFGYTNFRIQGRFVWTNKYMIDNQFLKDMYYHCSLTKHEKTCQGWADLYYVVAKLARGRDAHPGKREIFDHGNRIINETVREFDNEEVFDDGDRIINKTMEQLVKREVFDDGDHIINSTMT